MMNKLNLSKLVFILCLLLSLTCFWPQTISFHPRGNIAVDGLSRTMTAGYGSRKRHEDDGPQSSCHEYSMMDFKQIPNLHNSDLPAAYLIAPPTDHFSIGTLCMGVFVYIPHIYGKNASSGLKIDDYPPDSMYFEIIGKDFQIIPKLDSKYTEIDVKDDGVLRYYYLNVEFRDGDKYNITGYLECI